MPECLTSLPEPDRIFIGGGIGHDLEVLAQALRRLKPGGQLVTHLVLMGSMERTTHLLEELNYPFQFIQVQVSRSRPLAGDLRLESLNPVFVLQTEKPV
jgi:precorrin-6Y C5,15-methyltransferase (decarboxylating)